jgi:hypothetical protein
MMTESGRMKMKLMARVREISVQKLVSHQKERDHEEGIGVGEGII